MSAAVGPAYVDVSVVRTIADGRGDLGGWYPWDVIHNPMSGHILVPDSAGHCIRVFSDNPPYTYITQYGRSGRGVGEYRWPHGITCDSEGRVIVADAGNQRLQVLSSTGQYLGQVTGITWPSWVCVDGEDNMYVASHSDDIRVFNPQGEPLPSIRRRGRDGHITISGEHLYQVGLSNNLFHIHIHSLTDGSDIKTVALPQQIPNYPCITACRDGRLLITAKGWRAGVGADVINTRHSYIYVLDSAGHNLTPRPYRYRGRVHATTLLYDNTLVVVDREDRLRLVTLSGLNPPVQPIRPMGVARLENLCIYTIRSIITTAADIESLPELVAPALKAELAELYA